MGKEVEEDQSKEGVVVVRLQQQLSSTSPLLVMAIAHTFCHLPTALLLLLLKELQQQQPFLGLFFSHFSSRPLHSFSEQPFPLISLFLPFFTLLLLLLFDSQHH